MGAVINEGSMKSILDYIEIGKRDRRVITGGERATEPAKDTFIKPTVIADIQPGSKLEQEEIFGPVLAVIKSRNFEHALEIANDTEFGLTGAVYTKLAGQDRCGQARVSRRQSLYQSQVHRRDCGRASLRRIQHVGNGLEGGRPGLPVAVYAGEVGGRKDQVSTSGVGRTFLSDLSIP